jgi:hypothetical protein
MGLLDKKPKKQKSNLTRKERKADEMYKANPTWAAEDGYTGPMKKMKTGGMVNSNAKVAASKVAKGTVGGVSKAISKTAVKATSPKGRVGGMSKAPKTASPRKNK